MIEGRNYSLQVSEQDAPSMQKIVDEVNETLKSLHISFPNKDRQDCMAMTVAVKLYESRAESISPEVQDKLDTMEHMLDEVLTH